MAIKQTITDDYHFWTWLKNSDSYGNNFTLEGAKALQAYLDNLSDELEDDIEFDPIAWCVEYTEFANVQEAYDQHYGDASDLPEEQRRTTKEQQLEWFQDNTTVIEVEDSEKIIIADF